ncbi:MAG: class I tRNA ligase family protein, partial [Promethearchaeota archaeon]
RCKNCGKSPVKRRTKHWFLDFGKTEEGIRNFVENNKFLPSNARSASINFLNEGLPSRAITRDLEWGIPAPFEGADEKTIYVWFEAVLGYISAVKQWAEEIKKQPELFEYFWNDPETKTVFFVGKDNIIFHLIIFPGLLVSYNASLPPEKQYVMPYNVSSTEFLNYENDKFSKSRKIGIWIDDALELAPVEYWRYSLLRNRPEKQDANFMWDQFQKDVFELNDVVGNFVHRVLTFIVKRYDGKVPDGPTSEELDDLDKKFLETIKNAPSHIGDLMERFRLKEALIEIIAIARQGNIYLNSKAPWKLIKQDKKQAGFTFNLCVQLIRTLALLLAPFIPNVSQKMFLLIGSSEKISEPNWDTAGECRIPSGQPISLPTPLFQKLDIKELKTKLDKIHGVVPESEKAQEDLLDYETFSKLDLRIGTVLDAEPVPDANKLLKLSVDIGEDQPRIIVAGVAKNYTPETIKGTQIVVLTNLEPKEIRGVKSHGMLLAVDLKKKGAAVLQPGEIVPIGSRVR